MLKKHVNMVNGCKCAKPFVKWAGGKTQLLSVIAKVMPRRIDYSSLTYIEPFVGGGAVLFWILQRYPNIKNVIINDINTDLVNCYITIKEDVNKLIATLKVWAQEYRRLSDKQDRREYYYAKRRLFNNRNSDGIIQAALFIFLNRTCFNGLYRVNRKNEFNVPMGDYKTPLICDEENLKAVNEILQRVTILNKDFEQTLYCADGETLFYLDPPYRPLNETSSFNSYAKDGFGDTEQKRLAEFCEKLDYMGYKWILSNSDPTDDFFNKLYGRFYIKKVLARRNINSNPTKRGELTELLITNYDNHEQVMPIAQ